MTDKDQDVESKYEELLVHFNHLTRKNQALLNRIVEVENGKAEYEARAVGIVERLQAEIQSLREQQNATPEQPKKEAS